MDIIFFFYFICTLYVFKNDWVSELHFFLSCQCERRIMSWCRRVSFGLLDMSQYLSNSYLCRSWNQGAYQENSLYGACVLWSSITCMSLILLHWSSKSTLSPPFHCHITLWTSNTILQVRFLDMWEPAVLAIKREGYSVKCNGQRGVIVTEKFQQAMTVWFPKSLSLKLLCLCDTSSFFFRKNVLGFATTF